MPTHTLHFPAGYEQHTLLVEQEGWLSDVVANFDGRSYRLTFYNPKRLAQDIEAEHRRAAVFVRQNLVVVSATTRSAMLDAAEEIATTRRYEVMRPEP